MTTERIAATLIGLLVSSTALALDLKDIRYHGFASQAVIYTSDNRFFGSSDETSFEFTEIGLGSSVALTPSVHAAAQVGARAAGNTAEMNEVQLDFAVLDYSTNIGADNNQQAGLRVGRFRNPVGLQNETRDVLATRPGVMLPQSTYFDALGFRDLFISSDGLLLHTGSSGNSYSWNIEAFASNPRDDSNGAKTELTGASNNSTVSGKLSGEPLYGTRATLGLSQNFTIALTRLKYKSKYTAKGVPSASNLGDGNIDIDYTMLSFVLEREFVTLSSELVIAEIDRSGFSPSPRPSHSLASGYLRMDYRATDRVTPFVTYERYVYERDDPNGAGVEAATGGFIPGYYLYQRDLTLGSKWEIDSHWYVAAEYHYVEGTSLLSVLDNPNIGGGGAASDGPVGGDKYWTMATAMISYRF